MFVGTGSPRKPEEREACRVLRAEGMPIKRIAKALGVSPSSVHAWTRDIELTPEQKRRNLTGPHGPLNPEALAARTEAWKARHREQRRAYQEEGRARAHEADPLHLAGCMLYWAEGAKSRNTVDLANSDPRLVELFCRFLTESLGVPGPDLRVRINVYLNNGLTIEEIEDHWMAVLGIERSCFRTHSLDAKPTSSSGRRRNKLPYGVCTVQVHSTRVVQHIFGAIQEYGEFEEPRWIE